MTPARRLTYARRAVALAFVMAAAPASSIVVAQDPATPLPSRAALAYRIQVGDLLRLRLLAGGDQYDITGDFPVEQDGTAFFPRIGAVQAAGVTVEELRNKLRASYQQIFLSSAITIIPVFPVSVMGAVREPATVEAWPGMTVFDAIARAGGFMDNADRKRILMIREGRTTTLNAVEVEGAVGLTAITLQQNDRIMVEAKSGFTLQAAYWAAQVATLMVTIYVALNR